MMTDQKNGAESWIKDLDRLETSVDALVLSVQFSLQKAMREKSISHKELAERAGVSAARVSQVLSCDQANLTLRTLAKFADAIGEEFELVSLSDLIDLMRNNGPENNCEKTYDQIGEKLLGVKQQIKHKSEWKELEPANDNRRAVRNVADTYTLHTIRRISNEKIAASK